MNTSLKVGGYGLGLAAIFAAALGLGGVVGPDSQSTPAGHNRGEHPSGGEEAAAGIGDIDIPGGLQVTEDGYRLIPISSSLSTEAAVPLTFRITGPDGRPVTNYTPTHAKDLHLILIRRDLSGFQHLHPRMGVDGTWSVPVTVEAAGQYRIFADFQPAARAAPLTLGVDLPAAGTYEPVPLPPPSRTATVDGYTVTLDGDLTPGTASKLTLTVSKAGTPVADLQLYLAAYGHLVVLRDGDLAYLHVHPGGGPGDGRTTGGPDVSFTAQVPSAGAYRLFLDFRHTDTVRTAAFTVLAADAPGPATATVGPASGGSGATGAGHGHG